MPSAPKQSIKWDPARYAANSAMQQGWARELIARLKLRGDEHVLDVGCGDGKVTAEIARAVRRGRVLGVDSSPEMIAYAQQAFPRVKNRNLKFELCDAHDLGRVGGGFHVVFSNAALHWMEDHRGILRGAARALVTGGRLLISCGGQGNAREVFAAVRAELRAPPWRRFFRQMPAPYFFYPMEDYTKWLCDAGFIIRLMWLIPKEVEYAGAVGFATWLSSTWLPYVQRVPEDLRGKFIADVTRRYLAKHPPDAKGNVCVRMMRLEIDAVKAEHPISQTRPRRRKP